MKLPTWLRRPRKPEAQANRNYARGTVFAAGVTIPAVIAALAIMNPGIKVAEVDLNDGAVWITNSSELKLGRYNTQIKELNGAIFSPEPQFDVLQEGENVLLVQSARIAKVDPANMVLAADITMPAGATVSLGDATVAIVTPEGNLFRESVSELTSINEESEPTLELGPGAIASVTSDGTVYGLAPDTGDLHRFNSDGTSSVTTLEDPGDLSQAQLTAVGNTAVVLAGSTVYAEKTQVDLSGYGSDPVLQQVGPDRGSVLVATSTHLLEISVQNGQVTELASDISGQPVAPVWLGECAYGAWNTAESNYVRACDGPTEPQTLEEISAASHLMFRVNRKQIVLNDSLLGRVWLEDSIPQSELPNWSEILAPQEPDSNQNEPEDSQSQAADLAQCQDTDAPPEAVDDYFGVRAGRTSNITVLSNDTVGQCGIIAISSVSDLNSDFGQVEVIYGGRALQVQVNPKASGTATFTYTITDGRGTNPPSTASVVLEVVPDSQNSDPVQHLILRTEVEAGASVTLNALAAFEDPDGDQLILSSAVVSAGPGKAQFRQDGMVTYVADPSVLGKSTVTLTVTDGRGGTVAGTMEVSTRPSGSLAPSIDPIHEIGFVTQPVDVDVLAAVQSRSSNPVRLAAVEPVAGTTVLTDLDAGTFTFTAPSVGTYYLRFTVVAGSHSVTGLARIDVRDFSDQDQKPVAVSDIALLPAGGEVTVAPLANDFDPRGGVLVLTGVTTKPESDLIVGVIENRLVRISSRVTLSEPEEINYEVDNGVGVSTGTILVQPVAPDLEQHAPVVDPITVSVRTSGVVTIPALEYVSDPDSDPVKLVQEFPEPLGPGEGLLFVSGDTLRYQAPDQARTTKTLFNVIDSHGNIATGELTVLVHSSDRDAKAPPTPMDLTARAYSGKSVHIQIPLTGIDRDGDGVTLLGLGDQVPTLGRISGMGADWLEYTADPDQRGTDTFTYAVEDWTGQRAVGTIRVGIVSDSRVPLPIVASDDEVTVKPGTTVEVRVLRNDVDPSGLELNLEPLGVIPGVEAWAEGRRIVVEVPQNAKDDIAIPYAVTNALGNRGEAVLRVHVEEDAEIAAPIARDIIVAPLEVLDKDTAEVDVLEVAENPSGALSDLAVSVPASHSQVARVSGSSVIITLGPNSLTIPYRLTNTTATESEVYSYAFITVPAKGDFPPILRPKSTELVVAAGTELTIPLAAYVQVGTGKQAHIRSANSVRSNQSDGSQMLVKSDQLRFVSKPGFAGKASITFEVWDYAEPTSGERSTVLTLPISVYAEDKLPPVFQPTMVRVPQGDNPIIIDLLQLTSFPDGTDDSQVSFRSTAVSKPGVRVDIDGTKLRISADETVTRGTQGQVALSIGYGISGQVAAALDFVVVASNLPKPAVNNHKVIANAGEPLTIDVLAGANDPYGKGLRVSAVTVQTQGTQTTAVISANKVVVTPGPDFAGNIELTAVVTDALNDPNRMVESSISATVRKVPEPPRAPTISDPSSRTVKLSWEAPNANGAPIIDYLVTRSPSGTTTSCPATSCTITGLTNGTEYTFTVQARNDVGFSLGSASSSGVTPDALPGVPGAPSVSEGDRELTFTWGTPENEGTPITSYSVEISPSVDGRSRFESNSTSLTIKGLKNGTGYTAKIRANNSAKRVSDDGWSSQSPVGVPAGVPLSPTASASSDGDGRIKVTWPGGENPNGSPITGYTVTVTGEGGVVKKVDANTRQWIFTEAINGVQYEIQIQAENKLGLSAVSNKVKVSSFRAPDSPRSGTATNEPGRDFSARGAVKLSWQEPIDTGGRGVTITSYEIEGYTSVPGTKTNYVVQGLTPGQTSGSFRVRALSSRGAVSNWLDIQATPVATAPQAPTVSATGGWEEYGFTVIQGENGGAQAALTYRIDGQGQWTDVPANGVITGEHTQFSGQDSVEVAITVRATNTHGVIQNTGRAEVRKKLAPRVPKSLSATQITDEWKLDVNWLAPDTRGTPVTGYQICISQCADPAQWQETNGLNNYFTISSGLDGLENVTVRVRAMSAKGNSDPASVQVALVAPQEPGPPEENAD